MNASTLRETGKLTTLDERQDYWQALVEHIIFEKVGDSLPGEEFFFPRYHNERSRGISVLQKCCLGSCAWESQCGPFKEDTDKMFETVRQARGLVQTRYLAHLLLDHSVSDFESQMRAIEDADTAKGSVCVPEREFIHKQAEGTLPLSEEYAKLDLCQYCGESTEYLLHVGCVADAVRSKPQKETGGQ